VIEQILLIGAGAIGRVILRELAGDPRARIATVLVPPGRRNHYQQEIGGLARVIDALNDLDGAPDFALECAGHAAVKVHVPLLLRRGVDCALASVGSLAEQGLPELLEHAAQEGNAQLSLIPGAIAGIDAIAAARSAGLTEVIYTGRKPPLGWLGSPADGKFDLHNLGAPTVIFEGSAREAARLYPKNANVAATVSLAGIGLDRTRATLIADPGVSTNIHEVQVRGLFGELSIRVAGKPLPDNAKTSALAAWSAVRAVRNRVARTVI
jgi:aspartate dehydrogenase